MLGVCDIWKYRHQLKIIEEDLAKTMKAQRRNTPRAMVLWDVAQPGASPASAHLGRYHKGSHMLSLFKSLLTMYDFVASDTLIYIFPFLARYILLNLVQNCEAIGYCSAHPSTP